MKIRTSICSADTNTFLRLTDAGAKDMNGNDVVAVTSDIAVKAFKFVADTTSPRLVDFDVAMPTLAPPILVTVVFSETVLTNDMNASGFIFADGAGNEHRLTAAVVSQNPAVPTVISFSIIPQDLEAIRALKSVMRDNARTFLKLDSSAITDHNAQPVVQVLTPRPVRKYSVDVVPPTVDSFELDLKNEQIVLKFSEDVKLGTFVVRKISLQSAKKSVAGCTDCVHGLTGGPYAYLSADKSVVVVSLLPADVNTIKESAKLAVDEGSTFLTIEDNICLDLTAENRAVRIASEAALPVTKYTKDTLKPSMTSFDLNMNDGIMTMTFDEVVDAAKFNPGGLSLQNAKAGATETSPSLNGTASTVSTTTITLTLTLDSANSVRKLTKLAISDVTTFMVVKSTAFEDVDGNTATETTPFQVNIFKDDTTPPVATSFEINMDNGTMTVIYKQPVLGSSLNTTKFTLQDSDPPSNSYTLTGGTVSQSASTDVTITFNTADVNEIKRTPICASSTRLTGCLLRHADKSVLDARGLEIVSLGNNIASVASVDYIKDSTAPQLLEFTSLDLNNGSFSVKFSETVNRSSIVPSFFTIRASPVVHKSIPLHQLKVVDVVSTADSTMLTYKVSADDLNAIKVQPRLCTSIFDCYIQVSTGGVVDMAENDVAEVLKNEVKIVQSLSADLSSPSLTKFSLNVDSALLSLTFDETVDVSSLKPNHVTLQSKKTGGDSVSLTFTSQSRQTKVSGLVMDVLIDVNDMNKIKALQFCTSAADTFVSILKDTIADMANPVANSVKDILPGDALAVSADGYKADATRPLLSGFGLDLDTSRLTLSFNEPVTPSSWNATAFILQSAKSSAKSVLRLSGGKVEGTKPAMTQIVIMSEADIVSLKADKALGTEKGNLFMSTEDGVMADIAALQSVAIAGDNAVGAGFHEKDERLGSVQSFSVNFEKREITIVFNEIINMVTFKTKQVTIQSHENASNADFSHTLQSSKTSSTNGRTVVIDLSDEDVLAIGETNLLATSADNSFLQITAGAFEDTFGRNVVALTADKAQKAKLYVPDTTPPTITRTQLNMTDGSLTIQFSEAINTSSFVVTDLALQEQSKLPNITQQVGGAINVTFAKDAQSVRVELLVADLNKLKLNEGIATELKNTFIVHSSSMVLDLFDVQIASQTNGLATDEVNEDKRDPTLVSFDLNIDASVITFTFDETVRASTANPKAVTLQSTEQTTKLPTPTVSFTLRGGNASKVDGTVISMNITLEDINVIKQLAVAADKKSTFVVMAATAIQDMNKNNLAAVINSDATQVNKYTGDISRPDLVSFALDMTEGTITFKATETIERDSVNPKMFTLQNVASVAGKSTSYSLTGGTVSLTDSDEITVSITKVDMDAIKKDTELALDKATAYLVLKSGAAQDMSGNNVNFIANTTGLLASGYKADGTAPELVDFTFNMNNATLRFSFSETVDVSTFDSTAITLQSTTKITAGVHNQFNLSKFASRSQDDATSVTIVITTDDLNAIKLADKLAINGGSIFVSMTDGVVRDMNKNPLTAVATSSGEKALEFVPDNVGAVLKSTSLDMTGAQIVVEFDEIINIKLATVLKVRVQNQMSTTLITLSSLSTVTTTTNGLSAVISIHNDDMNAIRENPLIAVSKETTKISIEAGMVTDMAGNACTPQSKDVDAFTPDVKLPEMESFALDMSAEQLTLNFTETVNSSTLVVSQITILNKLASQVVLTSGKVVNQNEYTTSVVLSLVTKDLNKIKADLLLATGTANTFVSMKIDTIKDMIGNGNAQVVSKEANGFTDDSVKPTLTSFILDMDKMEVRLTFDETVPASTLESKAITIQNNAAAATSSVPLTGGKHNTTLNEIVVIVSLLPADANAIKKARDLGTVKTNTFISITDEMVNDMNSNKITPSAKGLEASSVIVDTRDPELVDFALNMNIGQLEMTFTETMSAATLKPALFVIQSSATIGFEQYRLTNGTIAQVDDTLLTIDLVSADMNQIKKMTALASSKDSTWLSIMVKAVQDMATNDIVPVVSAKAKVANNFTEDLTKPKLVSFDIDMHEQTVKFTFSETMDVSTFHGKQITIHSTSGAGTSHQLNGGSVSPDDSTAVVLTLTPDDFNALQTLEGMATGRANTYASLNPVAALTLADMNKNTATVIAPGSQIQATRFANDKRAAKMVSFDMNMDTGLITLVFSETMNVTSINVAELTLHSSTDAKATKPFKLTGEQTLVQKDSTTVQIKLIKADMEIIKLNTALCTDETSTFVKFTSAFIADQSGVDVAAQVVAAKVGKFQADVTAPKLISMALNVSSGIIILGFDESMEGTAVDVKKITIQNSASSSETQKVDLVHASHSTIDAEQIVLTLTADELNAIKKNSDLAILKAKTFVQLLQGAFADMAGNKINPTVNLCTQLTPDFIRPTLLKFEMNFVQTKESLTLFYDETMKASSVSVEELTFMSAKAAQVSYALTTSVAVQQDGITLTVNLTTTDVDELKRLDICTADTKCVLSYSSKSVTDMVKLTVDAGIIAVKELSRDTTAPELLEFKLFDYNQSIAQLVFSEPVVPTIATAAMEFRAAPDTTNVDLIYELAGSSTKSARGHTIVVDLDVVDLNAIKRKRQLCKFVSNCYVLINTSFIKDAFGNAVSTVSATTVPAFKVKNLVDDNEGAVLENFALDMEEGSITFTFDEPVVLPLLAPAVTIQNGASMTSSYVLKPATTNTIEPGSLVSKIMLPETDILAIKALTSLGTSGDDTYMSITKDMIFDLEKNANAPRGASHTLAVLKANKYTKDTTNPQIAAFTAYDGTLGHVQLTFNEPVDTKTLNVMVSTSTQLRYRETLACRTHSLIMRASTIQTRPRCQSSSLWPKKTSKMFLNSRNWPFSRRRRSSPLMLVQSRMWPETQPMWFLQPRL